MTRTALDSSILIAALRETEAHHEPCANLLRRPGLSAWSHALAETFATLSGAPGRERLSAQITARSIELSVTPRVQSIVLDEREYLDAVRTAESVGARGGAIYDYLHLCAARKARAEAFYTLNITDFRALARSGDPHILHP